MAWRTITPKTSLCVDAGATSAEKGVALTLVDVHAVFHHHKSTFIAFKTFTLKVSRSIDTDALATKVRRDAAFIDICAVPLFRIKGKSTVTSTLKTANGISAFSMGTKAGEHFAFIDVFREGLPTYLYLRREPRSPWAKSFKLRSSPERTLLTLVAPGCPHGAAAGVHAVPARDLGAALLVLVLQVATLQADVKTSSSRSI